MIYTGLALIGITMIQVAWSAPNVFQAVDQTAIDPAGIIPLENEMSIAPPIKEQKITFDQVPSEQVSGIQKRLEITGRILNLTGRAYDYRVLTIKQLEDIEKSLKK